MMFLQARTWDLASPSLAAMERLRLWLSELNARFGSWKTPDDEDDILNSADPQLVAALEFVASLFADEKEER